MENGWNFDNENKIDKKKNYTLSRQVKMKLPERRKCKTKVFSQKYIFVNKYNSNEIIMIDEQKDEENNIRTYTCV